MGTLVSPDLVSISLLPEKFALGCALKVICLLFLSECPKITVQPRSLEDIFLDTTVTFTVQATGAQPLGYLWEYKYGDRWKRLLSDMGRIQGVETATLTIDKVKRSDERKYRCVVSSNGSETSQPATLRLG